RGAWRPVRSGPGRRADSGSSDGDPGRIAGPTLTRRCLEQGEAGAFGGGEDLEASAREVLRFDHRSAAKLDGAAMRGVDVVDGEIDLPVARNVFGHHGVHLPGAGEAFAVHLELGVRRLALPHLGR